MQPNLQCQIASSEALRNELGIVVELTQHSKEKQQTKSIAIFANENDAEKKVFLKLRMH